MIQLGTIAAIGFDDFRPAEWLSCYRELGCRVVQAYRNQARQVSVADMRQAISDGGMPCDSLHGVYGEQYDPSCPDEAARTFAVQAFQREGEVCSALGGRVVVVHCATVRATGVDEPERRARINQLKKSIEELGRIGADSGIHYAFENLPAYHAIGSSVSELAGILRDVGAPNTGLCFDSGHAHMVGDAPCAVLQTQGQMIYAHISDNTGGVDGHEMITFGTIDADALARAFHRVGYSGTFMLEVFYSAARLRELIAQGAAGRLARLMRIANGQE